MESYINNRFEKYIEEYISFGKRMGYFNNDQALEFSKKLSNIDFKIDNSIDGDAVTRGNEIIINEKRLKSEEKMSLILFHEFTHICNSLHQDIFKDDSKSLIKKLRNNAGSYTNTNYLHLSRETKQGDTNNPFTYILFGGVLIDEVVSEHVASEMVKMKFNKPILLKNKERIYGDKKINYNTHFDYYGIGETLVDEFSRTLFLKNNCKNLNGLSKEIFKKDFVYELIHQHYERPDAFKALIEELAHMGVVAFWEEQSQGRYQDREKISPKLVYNSYNKLRQFLRNGREERENMPSNIPIPPFME